jgi:hypothetical protein
MTSMERGTTDLHRRAYEIAWREFSPLCDSRHRMKSGPGLTGCIGTSS